MSKFIVSYLVTREFEDPKSAIDAVTAETTEVREVTEFGSYGVNIEDLRRKVYAPTAETPDPIVPEPKEDGETSTK